MSLLKEIYGIIQEDECVDCEIVYVGENEEIIEEAAKRAYKRTGKQVKKMYRCTSGPKEGKVVSDPKLCMTRADPKKKRQGRKVMRTKGGVIRRKARITKRTASSKLVSKLNKRLSGN
jgi:hypothetical protein